MELSEVIKTKDTLEQEITQLLLKFVADTHLKVKDIEFFVPVPYTGGFVNQSLFTITVRVEI